MLCLLLPLLFGLVIGGQARAGTLTLDPAQVSYPLNTVVELLEDRTGTLRLTDVTRPGVPSFKPAGAGLPSFGFTRSSYWFRFDIDNPTASARPMILVLRTAWLDSIALYQADAAGHMREQHFGDTLPFAARDYSHPQFLVDLTVPPGTHRYYLRLSTEQAFMAPIELWEPRAFHQDDRLWSGYFGVFYGVLLVMMLYNGFIWFATRDRSYAWYCLYLASFFLMNFSYSGFAFQYLWPDSPRWLNWSYSAWIFLYQAVATLFAMSFLESAIRLPRLHRVMGAFLALLGGSFLLTQIVGDRVLYNQAAVYCVFLLAPLLLQSGIAAWRAGYRAARFYVVASAATLAGALVTALTVSGFLPYSFNTFHAVEFGIMADVVLLALALADRINFLREQKNAAERGVIEQRLRAAARLAEAKQELEHTVRERTAELARARDKAEHLARVDSLTGLSNRRYFEEVAAREFARARRYGHPLSVILFDIDFFKQINDSHGHAIGDQVIRQVAGLALSTVREVDFVARIGGEEFTILLPEITLDQAIITAERLREEIAARHLEHQHARIVVTASFGVTQLDPADTGFAPLLQRADQVMYEAKKAGRNRVAAYSASDLRAAPVPSPSPA